MALPNIFVTSVSVPFLSTNSAMSEYQIEALLFLQKLPGLVVACERILEGFESFSRTRYG